MAPYELKQPTPEVQKAEIERVRKLKGLGDVVEKVTKIVHITPCEGCKKRKEWLNKLFPFEDT